MGPAHAGPEPAEPPQQRRQLVDHARLAGGDDAPQQAPLGGDEHAAAADAAGHLGLARRVRGVVSVSGSVTVATATTCRPPSRSPNPS